MSTFDVIKRAAASRKNMVITHEPTFWTHNDDQQPFAEDAVYKQKMQFIRDNHMVVWRFHDHLHARRPGRFACVISPKTLNAGCGSQRAIRSGDRNL
jgi:hypothetical protein